VAVSLYTLIQASHATSSAYVLVLEAVRYLGTLTLLLRNFFQAIGRPPMETVHATDKGNLVFVPIGFVELASSNASSVILHDTMI
jgi:hypothetical protein